MLPSGITVAALVVANAAGSVVDPATGALYGEFFAGTGPVTYPAPEVHEAARARLAAAAATNGVGPLGTDAGYADAPPGDGGHAAAPTIDVPTIDAPTIDAPTTDAPRTDTGRADAPTTDAPPANAGRADTPTTDAPPANAGHADTPPTDAPPANAGHADTPPTDAPTTGPRPPHTPTTNAPLNTTLAVVATDAELSRAQAQKVAGTAHDGIARAVRPVHLLNDGDTVFALATGDRPLDAADPLALNEILAAGADLVTRAIVRAVRAAQSLHGPAGTYPAYGDLYGPPSPHDTHDTQGAQDAPGAQDAQERPTGA
ncbi:P1 family peptidase [Streptomyces sp. Q6]|uniref:P1 family peptidase n=1 Tax=Streptomyces citrinus TaxID=3118173 RepID=A0ACD5AFC3_9ACTN